MKCFNCKYEYSEDSLTCPACGSSNVAEESEDLIKKGTCPNCHAKLEEADICPKCGIDFRDNNKDILPSPEAEEKIRKVGSAIGMMVLLTSFGPFIGLLAIIALIISGIFLLVKGIVTEIQLANIIKIIFIVVPAILILLFSKYKGDNTKPVARKIIMFIALLFVLINAVYYVQPIVKFSNYADEEVLKLDGYSLPTIAKVYKGKPTTSFKVKESIGTVYTISYEGIFPKDSLDAYISLLQDEGFNEVMIDDPDKTVYAKYDGRSSMLVEINPGSPFIYQKCTNGKCVNRKIRDSYGAQYWFAKGNYQAVINEIIGTVKPTDDEMSE